MVSVYDIDFDVHITLLLAALLVCITCFQCYWLEFGGADVLSYLIHMPLCRGRGFWVALFDIAFCKHWPASVVTRFDCRQQVDLTE